MSSGAEPRLYIVDDDSLVAELVAVMGRRAGFEPRVVKDPGTLADLLRQDPASALVLDIVMPDIDGLEILKILGKEQFRGPILILSGMDALYLEAATRSAKRLGLSFSGTLSKPIDLAQLDEFITRMRESLNPS